MNENGGRLDSLGNLRVDNKRNQRLELALLEARLLTWSGRDYWNQALLSPSEDG